MKDDRLAERCRALRLILTDVDGVLTDGSILMLPDGSEAKSFHVRDGLAVVLAHRAGLRTGMVSGRSSSVVARRAEELGMAIVRLGVSDKSAALQEILTTEGIPAHQIAYVGDDLNDLALMSQVGLTAAPADAPFEVRAQAFMVLEAAGGRGCYREFVEAIVRARGSWEDVVASLGAHLP
jgi:3-deoxy-D-manno-octulosonate 8-phosphate phosphatase (KDO 8-P phosphatase)